jgi:hypothetical protein
MVIEFFGLPGSGKTYLSDKLACHFNEKNIKCINLVEKSRTILTYKVLFRILRLYLKISNKYKSLYIQISDLLGAYKNKKAEYNTVFINNYIEQIVLYCFLHSHFRNKKGLYILDEGVLQQIVNIIVNYDISQSDIQSVLNLLCNYFDSFNSIKLDISVDQSKNSMIIRNRHVCYIDELKGEELDKFLSKYYSACKTVESLTSPLVLNRNSSISYNITELEKFTSNLQVIK